MNDYEEKYSAFRMDEDMKKQFADYTIGIEMPPSLKPIQIETKVMEKGKSTVTDEGNDHA